MPRPSATPKPAWIELTCRALGGRTPLPDLDGVLADDPAWLEVATRVGVAEFDRVLERISPTLAWSLLIQEIQRWNGGVGGLQDLALRAGQAPRTLSQEQDLRNALLVNLANPAGFPVMREALRWLDPSYNAQFPAFMNRCLHEAVRQEHLALYLPLFKEGYRPEEVTVNTSLPLAAIQSGHSEEVLAHWDWVTSVTSPAAMGAALVWALTREDPDMFAALERAGDWPLPAAVQIAAWAEAGDSWDAFDQLGVRDPEGLPLRPALRTRLDAALRPLHDRLPHTRARHRERQLARQAAAPARPRHRS